MKVVIFCGGKGTRIRDASESIPKPLLPIGGRPILWHIMRIYAHYGINEFILCLGYKGDKIKEFFLSFHPMVYDFTICLGRPNHLEFHTPVDEADWKVTLADTGEETQTGARLRRVRRFLEGEDHFCATYGDGLADVDLTRLVEFHERAGKVASLTAVHTRGRFGEVSLKDGMVEHFSEKPYQSRERINGGFMVFDNRRVWDYLTDSDDQVLEKDVLGPLKEQGQLAGYAHDGFWQCMDSVREYTILNHMWASGNAPWKLW